MWKDKSSIQTKFMNKLVFIVFIATGLWCLVWGYDEFSTFKSEAQNLRQEYVEEQKEIIKTQVINIVDSINSIRLICEGDYPDAFEKQIQNKILNNIAKLRFKTEGYFFGSTYGGDPLFSNGKITVGSQSLWNLTDPNGVKIIQEQIKAVKNPEGGFVFYSWKKLKSSASKPCPKVAYVKGIPEWGWTIGTGVYLDTVEKAILQKKNQLITGVKKRIVRSMMILAGLLGLIYFWSKRIANQIKNSVETFSLFLKKASTDSVTINPDEIKLTEFKDLALSTNKMLADIKQAEEKLRRIEAERGRFLLAIEQSAEGIVITDVKGNMEYVNPSFERITGYSRQELIGRNSRILKSGEHDSFFYREMWETITSGKTWKCRIVNKKKDGHFYTEEATISPVLDETGAVINYVAIKRDITNEIKMEEMLQQSQRMEAIGTLAGGIAHDFNNILFPIVGHTEMLLEDIPEQSPLHESLNEIYTGAMRARDLVQQILAFSRQGTNELKLIKMQPIVKEVLKMIRSTIPTTIKITQNIENDCGFLKADPTQIHQIIMNLATNAFHAMEENGGELKVSLKEMDLETWDLILPDMEPGLYACLSVRDTGIGIKKELTEKIFDPFFTTKENGKGTGMGLSVVHGIVTGMGGVIKVFSEPGKGTEFHAYLPIFKSSFKEQEIMTKELIQGGTEKILIVDDEKSIVAMEKQMLERLGYTVTARMSSIEALEAFRANPGQFDMVISDIAMPKMPGDKLAVELIKIRPDIPILLCTGFSQSLSEEKLAFLGIKDFLLKPIIMKDLAQKMRKVLDQKNPEKSI